MNQKSREISIDMFVLGLFRFQNDEIVFKSDELDAIYERISLLLKEKGLLKEIYDSNHFRVFRLDSDRILQHYRNNLKEKKTISLKILQFDLGYYHHRVITLVKIVTESNNFQRDLRYLRSVIREIVDKIIWNYVVKANKELVEKGKIPPEKRIIFLYSYPLIIIHDGKKLLNEQSIPFSTQTETLFFNIIEPRPHLLGLIPRKKVHGVRISIPSTIVYADGKLSRRLVRDMINSIYQYALYEKKHQDIKANCPENRPCRNRLNETILTRLWSHMEDVMGGKTIDFYSVEMAYAAYVIAIISLIISIVPLIYEQILSEALIPNIFAIISIMAVLLGIILIYLRMEK